MWATYIIIHFLITTLKEVFKTGGMTFSNMLITLHPKYFHFDV